MPPRLIPAVALAWIVALGGAALGQTANASPTDPAPRGLPGTPRAVSRTPASVGRTPDARTATPAIDARPLPKPTAAERAEQKKLEHDLHICIGC